MAAPGLAGAGSVGIAFETTLGVPIAPADMAVWVPILDESLTYDETRYFSPQIRESVVVSDVEQGYYHVAGDITLEVDAENFVYWMYASRHTATLVAGTPNAYAFVPSQAGSTSTATGTTAAKTLTILVVRNGVPFSYSGCTVGSIKLDIGTDAVLKATLGIVGTGVTIAGAVGTPAYVAPNIFGAAAHTVLRGAAGLTPSFAAVSGFDGFSFEANHQAEPQNRIIPTREAAFVKYGETMISLNSTLDFTSDVDYLDMVNTTLQAFQLQSIKGGSDWGSATSGLQVTVYNGVFEKYDIPLKGLADIVTAAVTARGIGIVGGDAYEIDLLTDVTIS